MNGNQKQGIVGLYALGAYDIFSYLNNVSFQLFSPNFNISKQGSPTFKFTVVSSLISSTKDKS